MRRRLLAGLLLAATMVHVGCIVPIYHASPDDRARQLIFVSESLRHIPEIWERIWYTDVPDYATPHRVHGGIL